MKRARSPIASHYRMAWLLVLFDLPVGTPDERNAASRLRQDLKRDGFIMLQFSVYARPCASADLVSTHLRRVQHMIPPHGQVRGITITDAQWGRMFVFLAGKAESPEGTPSQMEFF